MIFHGFVQSAERFADKFVDTFADRFADRFDDLHGSAMLLNGFL